MNLTYENNSTKVIIPNNSNNSDNSTNPYIIVFNKIMHTLISLLQSNNLDLRIADKFYLTITNILIDKDEKDEEIHKVALPLLQHCINVLKTIDNHKFSDNIVSNCLILFKFFFDRDKSLIEKVLILLVCLVCCGITRFEQNCKAILEYK